MCAHARCIICVSWLGHSASTKRTAAAELGETCVCAQQPGKPAAPVNHVLCLHGITTSPTSCCGRDVLVIVVMCADFMLVAP